MRTYVAKRLLIAGVTLLGMSLLLFVLMRKVGVVAFSETAEVAAPATQDRQLAIDAVDFLYPQRGTAIGDGIARGVEVARTAEAGNVGRDRPAAILLLSDGSQTEGQLLPMEGAARAKSFKIPIYTVALGTDDGILSNGQPVPPDPVGLKEVADICREVNANGRSMGMALTSCTVPSAGKPTFELGDDEMEIGIGIHGEPGRERMKVKPVSEIVEMMATAIVDDLPFSKGDQVLAFVNGMGGTPLIELYIVYNELNKFLTGRGITISRNLIGSYITSLEMAGCSITLLKLDDDLTQLWDAPVKTAGLRWGA